MTQRNQRTKLMYKAQSAYKTAATVDTSLARVQRLIPTQQWRKGYDRGLGEGDYPAGSAYLQQYVSGGTIEANLNESILEFMQFWVGPKTGAGTSGDPYVLTEGTDFGFAAGETDGFTLQEINDTESTPSVTQFIGCVGTDFTIQGTYGQPITTSLNFRAYKDNNDSTAQSYSAPTDSTFILINSTFKFGETPSALTGVESFSINHTNGITPDSHYDISEPFMQSPNYGQKLYSGSFSLKMSQSLASTITDEFYGATGSPEDGSTVVTAPADNEVKLECVNGSRNLVLFLDQVSIDDIEKVSQVGPGIVVMTVNYTCASGAKDNQPIRWWS